MQFIIIAHDGKDEDALGRRLAVRDEHLALSAAAVKTGEQIIGAATLNETGIMNGSVMIVEYPSRKEVDDWLAREPYVTGGVWKEIEVIPCKVGPAFGNALKK